jgi:hypothetical protein
MLTLLKREIKDNAVYFLAAALFATILVISILSIAYNIRDEEVTQVGFALFVPTSIIVALGFVAMGVSQMKIDKTAKISFFLTSLPVSRNRILIVRIITGVLAILVLMVPILVTGIFLLKLFSTKYPIYQGFACEIFTASFLLAFACYCLGLQMGWSPSRFAPAFGGVIFTILLGSLVVVKGFGPELWIILLIFIAASLLRTWQKFTLNIL